MAYRLENDEPLREGLRRTAGEQLDQAIEELTEGVRSDPVKAIHNARKSVKKERSLLRLGRGSFDRKQRRRENAGFRAAAQLLSAARDADVMISALDELADRYAGQVPKHTFTAIRVRLEQERAAARSQLLEAAPTSEAAEYLRSARSRIDEWRLRRDGWSAISAGLLHSYRRGRRAAKLARYEPTAENLHAWRKRSKDLWYHLRLLRPISPHTMRGHAQDAHQLSDLLGDDHDLALLRENLHGKAGDVPVDSEAVIGVIDHRRAQLQTQAFFLGDRIYAEKPKSFRRRMHRYWDAWRAQSAAARRRRPEELAEATRHAALS